MSLDRDKIRRTLENDDVLKARTMKDELCNEIQSAYLNKELPETYKVRNILEIFLMKITVGMPLSRNEESLFEPFLTKFVKFMTIVSIFREKNKKGMSYNDYVFSVLGKYLWSKHHPKDSNALKEILIKGNEDETEYDNLKRYVDRVRTRRNKNLISNEFAKNDRYNFQQRAQFRRDAENPSGTYKFIKTEKIAEFDLFTILAHYSRKKNDSDNDLHVFLLATERFEKSSYIDIDDDYLERIKSIYHNFEKHKPISYIEYKELHEFMYEFYKCNSNFKGLDYYALEKKMCFQGIAEIINISGKYSLNKMNLVVYMKDLSDITLSLPTIGLRKCLLKIVEQDAYTYKMINLMDLKNLVMLINGIMEYKICYAITIMLDTWDILDICLDNVQEEHLLGVLISLIDINSETKYISIKSDTGYQSDEELFQMIYKHIFPEPRKQIRTKRKKQ